MTNWMNEAGEPYMTAAQLRFEAELDEQSWHEQQADYYMNHDPADDGDCCSYGDRNILTDGTRVCSWCEETVDDEDDECNPHDGICVNDGEECSVCREYWLDFHADGMEDQWLDGSYEE